LTRCKEDLRAEVANVIQTEVGMVGKRWLFFVALLSCAASVGVGNAQVYVWTGTTSTDWFEPTNWLGGTVPGNPITGTSIAIGIKAPFLPNNFVFNHFPVYSGDNSSFLLPPGGPFDLGHSVDTTFTMQDGLLIHDFYVGLGMGSGFNAKWIHNGGELRMIEVANHWFFVGFQPGATAELEVNNGLMHLGQLYLSWNGGTTSLELNGGEIRANEAVYFAGNTSSGQVTVDITGGLLKSAGVIQFGGSGSARATVNMSGGTVEAATLNFVRGTTDLAGGEMRADVAIINPTSIINFSGGSLSLTGDQSALVNQWVNSLLVVTTLPGHIVSSIFDGERTTVFATLPSLAGDFNSDGTVDAADYVNFRKGLGDVYTPADYDVWVAQFGQSMSGAASGSIAAVPEPSMGASLFTALVLAFVWRPLCRSVL